VFGGLALVVTAHSYGWTRLPGLLRWTVGVLDDSLHRTERLCVASLATGVLLVGLVNTTGVAGGSDSFAYMSQAELWHTGLPTIPQPWSADPPWPDAPESFAPLGYRAVGTDIKPIYAVGLPLLMAVAKRLGGQAAIFWLAPLSGAILVLIAYSLGTRVHSGRVGLIAAFLMATNWTLLSEVTAPMSDVVGAAGLAGPSVCSRALAPASPQPDSRRPSRSSCDPTLRRLSWC
jgi:hypothetical protein